MILQALTAYYEQLLRQGQISAPGWDNKFKVSFWLKLDENGTLIDLVDCRRMVPKGKKEVLSPQEISVPAHVKRTAGVAANFLCDNSSYLLGADQKGKPERAVQCFQACAKLHHKILDDVDCPAAKAILAYFDTWKPEQASVHPLLTDSWKELTGNANLIFCIEIADGSQLATTDPLIQDAWQRYYNADDPDADTAQCLITGNQAPVALVHPAIKGVLGAQSSGAALVSFNAPAFCSYGHEQGANAPVSEYAAFAYTTALNTLLSDRNHCKVIGDTTVICWAENASPALAALGMAAMFGPPEDSGIHDEDLSKALGLLAAGKPCSWLEETLTPEQHFYFLGLSPNAARVSVRFFLRDTLQDFARHMQQHFDNLEIVRPAYDKRELLSIWALAMETVNRKERNPSPSPQLVGDLLRSILTGGMYPATLLHGVTLRIRAEREITRGRAAILKAYYLRNASPLSQHKEVLTVKLNEESKYCPYVLGRLFAVLEAVQDAANPNLNTTIKDRYFSSACATPAVVFPTLVKLAQKHLQKLEKGSRTFYNQQITALMSKLDETFPTRMTLPEQGAFELGYYHQTQKRYAKKSEEE